MNEISSPSNLILNTYEYEAHLGQTHPVWQPVPQHYYPLSSKQIIYYIIFVFLTIIAVLGLFFGFVFWAVKDLAVYVLIWSIVLILGVAVSILFLYFGGKDRRTLQKMLIEQTNRKQQQMILKKN